MRESGLNATILRPWYVLGPGHRWPYALLPMYWLMEVLPSMREARGVSALVTLEQMVGALVDAVERVSGYTSRENGLKLISARFLRTKVTLELRKRMHVGHLFAPAYG